MGVLADAALRLKCDVVGVILGTFKAAEIAHVNLTRLIVTDPFYERKPNMIELSNEFAILPSGRGTMDELFGALTLLQKGFHSKPVGLLNMDGCFSKLLSFLDHAAAMGFISFEHRNQLTNAAGAPEFLEAIYAQAEQNHRLSVPVRFASA